MIIALLSMSGCSIYDHFVSPGRIDRGKLTDGVKSLQKICNQGNCKQPITIIGHAGASYREYPMYFNSYGKMVGNTRHFLPIASADMNCLIDQAFRSKEIQAVELDLQKAPNGHPLCHETGECVYIMHNAIDWQKLKIRGDWPAVRYFENNSMQDVLTHYLADNDFQNSELFLELKSKEGCTALSDSSKAECTELSRRIAFEIKPYLQKLHGSGKHITFISFSAAALKALHDSLDNEGQKQVRFALIAGMYEISAFAQWVGQAKGHVPYFEPSYREFIINTPWLDSVWFSPQAIPGFNQLFAGIYAKREAACQTKSCHRLGFSVSGYQFNSADFSELMTAEKLAFPLTSIMIDVDDAETPFCKSGAGN